jgi:hypothetical protein
MSKIVNITILWGSSVYWITRVKTLQLKDVGGNVAGTIMENTQLSLKPLFHS